MGYVSSTMNRFEVTKFLAIVAGLFLGAFQVEARQPTVDIFSQYDSQFYVSSSFTRGGASFGVSYERNNKGFIGLGTYAHYYAKDTQKNADGVTVLGVFMSPHIDHGDWDCYFVTGFAYQRINKATGIEDGFGPSFAVGVLYHLRDGVAFGIEKTDHFDWSTSHDKGPIMSDLVAKVRFSF